MRDRWLKLGWTLEEALTLDYKVRPHRTETIVNGVKYRSQNEAARASDINIHTYRNRLAKGYDPSDASDEGFKPKQALAANSLPFLVMGKPYVNLSDYILQHHPDLNLDSQELQRRLTNLAKYRQELCLAEGQEVISMQVIADDLEIKLPRFLDQTSEFWEEFNQKVEDYNPYFLPELDDYILSRF